MTETFKKTDLMQWKGSSIISIRNHFLHSYKKKDTLRIYFRSSKSHANCYHHSNAHEPHDYELSTLITIPQNLFKLSSK